MALSLFNGGYLPLEQRSMAENLFWAICTKLQTHRPDDGRGAGGSAEPRRAAVGHLLLQLLAVPVDSRQLGDQAAVPGDADPPAEREADEPRRARRHHLRLGRQARSLRRPPRREEDAAAARRQRRRATTSACSSSARTRRSSATCTTCSATRTPSTSASTSNGNARLDALIKGDTVREVLDYVEFDAEIAARASCAPTSRPRCAKAGWTTKAPASCSASTKTACTGTPTSRDRSTFRVPRSEHRSLEPRTGNSQFPIRSSARLRKKPRTLWESARAQKCRALGVAPSAAHQPADMSIPPLDAVRWLNTNRAAAPSPTLRRARNRAA